MEDYEENTEPEEVHSEESCEESGVGWKDNLSPELKASPMLEKFEDSPEGLSKAMESHANLEKLLGHEKIPIPKDKNDVEGWNRFSKAMGIPNKAEEYGLPDADIPESMQEVVIDKERFAEIMYAHKMTSEQAKGLWADYIEANIEGYNQTVEKQQDKTTDTINRLRGDWGDEYDTNVALGQMVINKFSDSDDTNEYLTNVFSQSPLGIKFLAKIGSQFAENKVGMFQMKKFGMGHDEAKQEIEKIRSDPNHAYNSSNASTREHNDAVEYVNALYATVSRQRG